LLEGLEDRTTPAVIPLPPFLPDGTGATTGAHFGTGVAADGNYFVVGAELDDTGGGANAGRAYVFNASSGALLHTLNNPTPAANDYFGWVVAVSGNFVVVGADGDDTGAAHAGSAYVFDASTGAYLRTLQRPTPAANDGFGWSVAVSGNIVVVGSPFEDAGPGDAGRAYVFNASTGALLSTLNNPTPAAFDQFGKSVAVSGNLVVVGAEQDDTGAGDSGSAYLFDATTGALIHTLANPTPAASAKFGSSVSLSGNLVVVGTPNDSTDASASGRVHVFDASTGTLSRTLVNPTPAANDHFGTSVAVSGHIVVVGAADDDTGGGNAGSAYVFDANTGTLLNTLNKPIPAASDNFGYRVAISGGRILVGAPYDDTQNPDQGAAYGFIVNSAPTALNLSSNTVAENVAAGTVVGTLSVTDPDAGDTHTYTLVGGDMAAFSISGNQLLLAVSPDFETQPSYTVRIRATDQGGLFIEQDFTINIQNLPEGRRIFAVGAGAGMVPHIKVYNAATGAEIASFFAYDTAYIGGVRVAVGDVNGDGIDDIITGTTPNTAGGHVKVIDGSKLNLTRPDGVIQGAAELYSFFATPGFSGGIYVAAADVNNDGKDDIVIGVDQGMAGGLIRVYSGANGSLMREFKAFSDAFLGGVRVAGGDVNGDGTDDIIAGSGFGATPHIKVFSGTDFSEIRSWLAYSSAFMGGVFVASDHFGNDPFADIVTSAGGGLVIPHVKVFEGQDLSERASFLAATPADGAVTGGPVGAVDRTGDGLAEVLLELGGPPSSQVRTIDPVSTAVLDSFFAFPGFLGDIFIG
jgi:hypothetical protein